MLSSPRNNGLDSLFKEVRVFKVIYFHPEFPEFLCPPRFQDFGFPIFKDSGGGWHITCCPHSRVWTTALPNDPFTGPLVLGKKNINKFGGLSRVWWVAKICLSVFWGHSRKAHTTKSPENPRTIPAKICLCLFFLWVVFALPIGGTPPTCGAIPKSCRSTRHNESSEPRGPKVCKDLTKVLKLRKARAAKGPHCRNPRKAVRLITKVFFPGQRAHFPFIYIYIFLRDLL